MTWLIGIDPGMKGAIAIFHKASLYSIHDMPVADGVNAAGVADVLRGCVSDEYPQTTTVVIEDVQAYPVNGSIGNFKLGVAKGILLGVVASLGCETQLVRPATWKRQMGLSADKDLSRQRAIELWPDWYEKFARKKDDGRAEAALLARWYYDKFERTNA